MLQRGFRKLNQKEIKSLRAYPNLIGQIEFGICNEHGSFIAKNCGSITLRYQLLQNRSQTTYATIECDAHYIWLIQLFQDVFRAYPQHEFGKQPDINAVADLLRMHGFIDMST